MYGFEGVGLSGVQLSISELSVVGGWGWVGGWMTRQTHFMVGPGRGPTKTVIQKKHFRHHNHCSFICRATDNWKGNCLWLRYAFDNVL